MTSLTALAVRCRGRRVAGEEIKHSGPQALTSKLPRVQIKQTGTAEQVRSAAAALSSTVLRKCNSCGGDGGVNVKVTVGRTRAGRPIHESGVRACGVCDGKGSIAPLPGVSAGRN